MRQFYPGKLLLGLLLLNFLCYIGAAEDHWAFKPIQPVPPPKSGLAEAIISNPVDRLIVAGLVDAGLKPSAKASKRQLLRRLTFDLIGLPPRVEESQIFLNDDSPQAYENVVDRLLASPHYGERWGRHWLDLVRYAETDGFEHDAVRPHAWRYRDYVIDSFNSDKPYDRFIQEQLAGDELWPNHPEAIVATAFNLLGPDMVDSSDQIQRRHNTLNDMTDTTALVFLGLTMGCARCHDHKFEPLTQRDYYSLQAFFTPAKFIVDRPIPTAAQQSEFDAALKKIKESATARELAQIERPAREKIFARKAKKLSPEARMAYATPAEVRTAEQANLVLETEPQVAVSDQELSAELSQDEKQRRKLLLEEMKKLSQPRDLPRTLALADNLRAKTKTFILHRGEYSQPGEEVPPGFPAALSANCEYHATKGHRRELAAWIASERNPLTARVMVNRIWQHHFGRGLVISPNEFGTHGQKPSHPELLDWLANEFIARGWRIKHIHKLIVMSATYQQSSSSEGAGLAVRIDPDNKLLWRMNRLRLEGEIIRDTLLAISGQLNPQIGGPSVYPAIPKELLTGVKWPTTTKKQEANRRSIYIFARRNLRFPFLEVFDAPDNNLSCPERGQSSTAPQSLTLLNGEEGASAAREFAQILTSLRANPDEQITAAYERALGRPPRATELMLARDFLKTSPLSEFCRALFNLNEFVYVE